MHTIKTIDGREVTVSCIACAISKKEIEVFGVIIAESEHFQVANDFEIPIPGFLIVNSKRHIQGSGDFSLAEAEDFGTFLSKVRKAMREVLDIKAVTLIQEEKTENSHFHMWLFPWYEWMKEIGVGLTSIPSIMEHAKEHRGGEGTLTEIAAASEKLRRHIH